MPYSQEKQATTVEVSRKQVAVKPAADPSDGSIVETTSRRRIIPAGEAQSAETPDLWTYLRSIPQSEWGKHMVYVYRISPPPSITLLKSGNQYLTMPAGAQVSLTDQEEVEFALTQAYGGGTYRVIVKKGPQWVTQGKFDLGGPSRAVTIPIDTGTPTPGAPTMGAVISAGADPTAAVAGRAFDALNMQERTSAEIGFAAMRTGLDAVTRAVDISQRAPQPNQQDDVTRQFMVAMMTRLTQDPMEQIVKMFTLMRELNSVAGMAGAPGGLPPDMMTKIVTAMFEKFMNPTPTGPPVSGLAEAMRQAPGLINGFAEVMREQRLLAENQTRLAALSHGVALPSPTVLPAAQQNPPPPANGANGANGAPTMEFVETKIIEILRQPVSAAQAADDAMTFLSALDAGSVGQFAAMGEAGLLQFFQSRPILKQACNNMPRLVEFIRAFLKLHVEDQAAEEVPPPPAPLPN